MQNVLALYQAGRLQEADAAARKLLQTDPRNVQAMNLLGVIAHDVGRNDLAVQWYERAVRINPSLAMLYNNLGEAYRALGQADPAIAAYQNAIQRDPADPTARNNLAIVFAILGRLDDAIHTWQELLKVRPDFIRAMNNLANALLERGRVREAVGWHRKALKAQPGDVVVHSNLLRDLQNLPDITPQQLLDEHRIWWNQHGKPLIAHIRPHANDRDPNRRLKVGFVSADLREHAVAFFIEPLFEHHDRNQFHFIAYSQGAAEDDFTERLKRLVEQWRPIRGLRDEQADELIRADAVDILIDLAGHTAGSRATLFARKPAPIQVSYLGYPSTTGIETIDYRITDAFADPPGMSDAHYTERLVRLPRCAWCFRPYAVTPAVSNLPAQRNGHVTFGSFNAFSKVNARVIDTWAEILRHAEFAKLLLKTNGLGDPAVQQDIRNEFQKRSISPDRILMLERDQEPQVHLSRYGNIDIALDTFPYNGTTTTCEALWMGVPVITLAGHEHRSRVGVSLLTNVGLADCVAQSPNDYVAKSLSLAAHPENLKRIRATLRPKMNASPLRDEPTFTRYFESTLRTLWQSHLTTTH